MRVGIVVGSVREVRNGIQIGEWVHAQATARGDADYALIDLRTFDLPVFNAPVTPMTMNKAYPDERVRAWSAAVDACDALVFVTPEYNHGIPGAFKNAVDHLGTEFVGKAVSFVGYGAVGGVRAIEQWRGVVANFRMVDVRSEVTIHTFGEFVEGRFVPAERRAAEVAAMLDELLAQAVRQKA